MAGRDLSPFARALAQVEHFSEKAVAVVPEKPSAELLSYVASVTGDDEARLSRLYDYFISLGRLDAYVQAVPAAELVGFAEE